MLIILLGGEHMAGDQIQVLIAMVCYILVVIGIGLYFMKRSNKSSEEFLLGGRSLGPWMAAFSAEASDMSGWLLMGLPGVAFWMGLADAAWTAIGLAIGTYFNWLIVAKRLRRYSVVAGNAITLPDFFSNRFREGKKVIMMFASVFILIFFTVYASSCFVTCGKLFSMLFGFDYVYMMILGAIFVLIYTFIGGFLAESASDFMQAIVMVVALCGVLICGIGAAGGIDNVLNSVRAFPGFLEFFAMAQPEVVDGVQQTAQNGMPLFGSAAPYGFLTIISTMAWGLGYFGMPQVLLRFMAIRKPDELKKSRRIATVWVLISLSAAVFIGVVGRSLYPAEFSTYSASENIFIVLSTRLLPPMLAGIAMSGILAATISSSDSYLLIAASAFSKNIYQGIAKKGATDKQVMVITRVTLIVICVLGVLFAMDENSVIFEIVSFAWAGFGATFGPLLIFSLFWKRINNAGALAGMFSGAGMVFIWKLLIKPLGGVFGIYELLPAFIFACAAIVVVSLMTKEPSKEIQDDFELVRSSNSIA